MNIYNCSICSTFPVLFSLLFPFVSSYATSAFVDGLIEYGTTKLALFVPQLVLFSGIVAKYGVENLPVCLLLQTIVFVIYNKVITAQYFTWFMCLVPLCIPSLRRIPLKVGISVMIIWVFFTRLLVEHCIYA